MLTAAGAHTEEVLRAALTAPDQPEGGTSVDAAWTATGLRAGRRTAAEQAARAWTAQGPAWCGRRSRRSGGGVGGRRRPGPS